MGMNFQQTLGRKKADVSLLLLLLSRFSRVRLCDPTDGSPPGSSLHRIFQARILEWVTISVRVFIKAFLGLVIRDSQA